MEKPTGPAISQRPLRVMLCLLSAKIGGGGIASVNRAVMKSLGDWNRSGVPLQIRSVLLADAAGTLPEDSVEGVSHLQRACGGSRWRFVANVLKEALVWRPDFIFVDHLHIAVVAYLLRPATSGYVLFCHGVEFDGNLSRWRRAAFVAARMRLSNSNFTAQRLMRKFPGIEVQPCELGLETDRWDDADLTQLKFPNANGIITSLGTRAVLIVGRMDSREQYKGHDQLIDAFADVVTRCPAAQLVVAGSGDDVERLKEKARKSEAAERILFAGFLTAKALNSAYASCRIFAMPSRGEGFGLVYLEAMRHGKPCIASNVDAGSEVVRDGETGYCIDPDSREDLVRAVVRLLDDDELCGRLGEAGKRRLETKYRYHCFRDRFLAAIAPALDRNWEPPLEVR